MVAHKSSRHGVNSSFHGQDTDGGADTSALSPVVLVWLQFFRDRFFSCDVTFVGAPSHISDPEDFFDLVVVVFQWEVTADDFER